MQSHSASHFTSFEQETTTENFVIRRYLETLWLPEVCCELVIHQTLLTGCHQSFNPLSHFIVSLRRIGPSHSDRGNECLHPLHTLLEPLLLTTSAASNKYRTELVEILENGEGGGGPEESMMWYAWEHEKAESDNLDETTWRKQWLEKLEHREYVNYLLRSSVGHSPLHRAMIQILITMLKISLPGPNPSARGRSLRKTKRKELPEKNDEERLESFMDRLAVWQLTSSLDTGLSSSQGEGSSQGKAKSDRHWTQVFCEDVVDNMWAFH